MATPRGLHVTGRGSPPLQRWLTRLIVFSIIIYGSLLVAFSAQPENTPAHHSIIRQRSLQGIIDQKADVEAIQLLRINIDEDNVTSPSSDKAAIASTTTWKHRATEILSEIREEQIEKTARAAGSASSGTNASEDFTTKQISHAPGVIENDMRSRSGTSSFTTADRQTHHASSQSNIEKAVKSSEVIPVQSTDIDVHKADLHARTAKLLPADETRKRALKCVGWRNTGDCSPDGPRQPHQDLSCSEFVPNNASGYCEVEDMKSGERFRVMRHPCNILRNRVPFRCINAPTFARFRVQAHATVNNTSMNYSLPNSAAPALLPRDGIVMVVYPKLVPSAFATIRALREILDCSLPIEIWFRPDELEHDPKALAPLQYLARNISVMQISFREITDPVAKRFVAKIYAINHSVFDRVLFLDADNVPVRDPTFLFESSEFKQTGAIFWPDFWHPTSTMFGLHSKSLLWELLGMPFVDMFEQESGQLVVDRRLHAAPLGLVYFYATHDPNFLVHYKLVWGDKDLFRLAWLKLNATFHMIETPPAMAGMVTNTSAFCGMTMVQHDSEGKVLFLHRNKHKLTGVSSKLAVANSSEPEAGIEPEFGTLGSFDNFHNSSVDAYPDPAIWTHLLSFDGNWSRDHYVIQAFTTALNFTSTQKCFGRRSLRDSPQFHVQPFADFSFTGFETDLRRFAKAASENVVR